MKRDAVALYKAAAKAQKTWKDYSQQELPADAGQDWQKASLGYSNLEHMTQTPMARTVLRSLRQKGANIKFMCADVCGAAVAEGSTFYQTRSLSSVDRESKFHHRLEKDLPKVDKVTLPVQIKKKLKYRSFSPLFASYCTHGLYLEIGVQYDYTCSDVLCPHDCFGY